jgi:hypothetical protein
MRTHTIMCLFMLCASSARAEILFQGYMISSGKALFVLSVDKEKVSGWLSTGQNFDGYSLRDFDPKTETLTVEKEGRRQALRLVDGKLQTVTTSTSHAAIQPIVISIGENEKISVGDDVAMLSALKARFEAVAAMTPQPTVTIRSPADATFTRIRTIMDLCKAAGINRFSIGN